MNDNVIQMYEIFLAAVVIIDSTCFILAMRAQRTLKMTKYFFLFRATHVKHNMSCGVKKRKQKEGEREREHKVITLRLHIT